MVLVVVLAFVVVALAPCVSPAQAHHVLVHYHLTLSVVSEDGDLANGHLFPGHFYSLTYSKVAVWIEDDLVRPGGHLLRGAAD